MTGQLTGCKLSDSKGRVADRSPTIIHTEVWGARPSSFVPTTIGFSKFITL